MTQEQIDQIRVDFEQWARRFALNMSSIDGEYADNGVQSGWLTWQAAHARYAGESGPVAEVVSKYGDPESFGEREIKLLADIQKLPYRTKLYTHPVRYAGSGEAVRDEFGVHMLDLPYKTRNHPAPAVPDDIRPEVMDFARAMQYKLDKNRNKPGPGWPRNDDGSRNGWKDCDIEFLFGKLYEEIAELAAEVEADTQDKSAIRDESADIGNIAMFIADVCGALTASKEGQ